MGRGGRRATVHGAAKSWTWLSTHMHALPSVTQAAMQEIGWDSPQIFPLFFLSLLFPYSYEISQSYGFSSSHVWMWELVHKESWAPKNWCFWNVVLGKTLESPLDCREIKPVNPKENQPWVFIGRTDAEVGAPILWPPDSKSWLIWRDLDAGKDWRQIEKAAVEDTDSMDMNLSKLREIVENRGAWRAAVHGVVKTWFSNWMTTTMKSVYLYLISWEQISCSSPQLYTEYSYLPKPSSLGWWLRKLNFVLLMVYIYIVHGQGFPGGTSGKESSSNAGDAGLIPGSGRSFGEGNGNPLQYSCLENSIGRGTWQAAVHGATKSWTQLSNPALNGQLMLDIIIIVVGGRLIWCGAEREKPEIKDI